VSEDGWFSAESLSFEFETRLVGQQPALVICEAPGGVCIEPLLNGIVWGNAKTFRRSFRGAREFGTREFGDAEFG